VNWIIWFFIALGIFFLGLFALGFIILYRVSNKKKIRINILLKARQWVRFKVKITQITNKDAIKYKDGVYTFDDRAIIKARYCDNIYYFEGNPEPIVFDFQQNKPKVQSQDLQTILDSDLIEKLFSEKRLARMEMLLVIVLIVCVVTLLATGGQYAMPTSIVNDKNAEFIANITRSVIIGG
jgi:hypothetical protein